MPLDVDIDHDRRLVSSVWAGEVNEALCIAYIEGVWGDPAVGAYDELVDFREVTNMDLPLEAIQRLVSRSRSVSSTSRSGSRSWPTSGRVSNARVACSESAWFSSER